MNLIKNKFIESEWKYPRLKEEEEYYKEDEDDVISVPLQPCGSIHDEVGFFYGH